MRFWICEEMAHLHSKNLPSQIHYSEFGDISLRYKLFIKESRIEQKQSRNCKKIEKKKINSKIHNFVVEVNTWLA